ncbi:MAG: hypothetical protein ACOX3T_00010 [Bdellovibrionota bacterium]
MKKLTLLLFIFFLTSCVTTKLEPKEISKDLQRLSYANWNPVCIEVKGNFKKSIGRQYVVPFIPLGEIVLEKSPRSYIYSSMYKVLSLARFTPKFNSNECKDMLRINIKDLRLSAYDLFFTRRIVGRIKYQIVYTRNGVLHDIVEDSIRTNYYKRYAFKPELEYVLNKLLDEFSQEAVDIMKFF